MREKTLKTVVTPKKRILNRHVKKYAFIASVWIYPTVLFAIFWVGVNFNSLLLAFQRWEDGRMVFAGFENFQKLFANIRDAGGLLLLSLKNTLLMFALCFIISNPLYIIFSYYIYKKWPLARIVRIIMLIPAIVSGFVICLVFLKFVEIGLPRMMLQITGKRFPQLISDPKYSFGTMIFYMIWISFTTSLIIYPNAMNAIDKSIIESGQLDGVNNAQELWHIILPNMYAMISTTIVMGVAGLFAMSGPLILFFKYSAPREVYNLGYYMFRETMINTNDYTAYPYLASMGLVLTALSAPLTFTVKYFLDKYDPLGGAV